MDHRLNRETAVKVLFLGWLGAIGLEQESLAQVPVGDEIVVSPTASGGLHDPEVSVAVDGSFFVAWQESLSSGTRLSGRAFDAKGLPRSSAIQVEGGSVEEFSESNAAIDFSPRRSKYRIAWTSFGGVPNLRVRSRELSLQGQPTGTEVTVAAGDSDAYRPAVALTGTERWLLVWGSNESNGIDTSAYVQAFRGESPLAPPARLNRELFGYYGSARAATSPLGASIVVWLADYDRLLAPVVRGRRVSADGALLGTEFGVASPTAGAQVLCDVAMDSRGRFVVAWEQSDSVSEGSVNIYARRFDSEGVPLSDPFQVATESAGAQYDCDLAMNREGDFAIAWKHDQGTATDLEDLYVRAFHADGTAYGAAARVDETRPPELLWVAGHPSVSINDGGVVVVAWEGQPSGQPQQIFARRFVLPCSGAPTSLCLADGRFRLHADWWVRDERTDDGTALPLREETGGFWFFAPDIPEVIVKVLDGCGSNDHYWIYAAGLTDVEAHLSVTDTATGEIWSRVNPWRQPFSPLQDIEAMGGCPDLATTSNSEQDRPESSSSASSDEKLPVEGSSEWVEGSCVPGTTTLCLFGGRFEVSAMFKSWTGGATPAFAEALTAQSGMFWFFAPQNLELFVKIVDACAEFDRYWMFAAGLTNLEVELTVRDRWAEQGQVYSSALGSAFELIRDTGTFATCAAGTSTTPLL